MSTRAILSLALVALVGCGGATNSADSTYVDGVDSGSGSGTGTAVVGIPCDVATVLANKCVSCHSNPPTSSAPFSINSYDDLAKAAPGFPGQTVAQRSVARMRDATSPMPPAGGATAAEIATIQAWIDGGMPKGDCAETSDAGPSPWDAPVGCVSGKKWAPINGETRNMRPGEACVTCHLREGANPREAPTGLAGTVFTSAHEVDRCYADPGVAGAVVVITGADGKVLNLSVSATSGNFYTLQAVAKPYSAKVVDKNGKERAMAAKQTDGDCNKCHTQDGAGDPKAPGRIIMP